MYGTWYILLGCSAMSFLHFDAFISLWIYLGICLVYKRIYYLPVSSVRFSLGSVAHCGGSS